MCPTPHRHHKLVEEVVKQITVFAASTRAIRKSIGALIDRGYIRRDASNAQIYIYMS